MPPNQNTDQLGVWAFPRHLAAVGPGFDDEAPTVMLQPIGAPPAAP
jgi:hypothetical protein